MSYLFFFIIIIISKLREGVNKNVTIILWIIFSLFICIYAFFIVIYKLRFKMVIKRCLLVYLLWQKRCGWKCKTNAFNWQEKKFFFQILHFLYELVNNNTFNGHLTFYISFLNDLYLFIDLLNDKFQREVLFWNNFIFIKINNKI